MSLTKEQFATLLAEHDRLKGEMDEVRGTLGQRIQDWEDTKGIHRGAFKQVAKLRRMEASARTAFLEAFDIYRELADLDDSPTMWDEAGEGEGAQAREAGPGEPEEVTEPQPGPGPEEAAPENQEPEEPEGKPRRGRKRKDNGSSAPALH